MRWTLFIILAVVAVFLELSLRTTLELRLLGGVTPSIAPILLTFIALFAPREAALWCAWGLGLLMDLYTPLPHGAETAAPLIGPMTLGFVFAAFVVVHVRAMLFRRRMVTVVVMAAVFVAAAQIVAVFIYAVHSWYPGAELAWADRSFGLELVRRLAGAAYTGLLGLLVAPVLLWTLPAWRFDTPGQRPVSWR
jgi:rod shape-determining protein MreD